MSARFALSTGSITAAGIATLVISETMLKAEERAGRFSGRRFFVNGRGQKHDWYQEGTDYLLPANHELFSGKVGHDLKSVKLRQPPGDNANPSATASTREIEPFLHGIEVTGLFVAVVYSKHDISCALAGKPPPACTGYGHADAVKIAVNVCPAAVKSHWVVCSDGSLTIDAASPVYEPRSSPTRQTHHEFLERAANR